MGCEPPNTVSSDNHVENGLKDSSKQVRNETVTLSDSHHILGSFFLSDPIFSWEKENLYSQVLIIEVSSNYCKVISHLFGQSILHRFHPAH